MRKISWHKLRHTFATQLVKNGVQMRAIQKLLGHSSMKMTERYAHVAPDTMRHAIDVLEGGFYMLGLNTGRRTEMVPLNRSFKKLEE